MQEVKEFILDRQLVLATQDGLPLVTRPYAAVADRLGLEENPVLARFQAMIMRGVIRRIGAVPNHYALGYSANGMTVWDIADDRIAEIGPAVGALSFVSHCYQRPRQLPEWPYTLFAMVHACDSGMLERQVERIKALIGSASHRHEVLLSTRILKKTGLRLLESSAHASHQ